MMNHANIPWPRTRLLIAYVLVLLATAQTVFATMVRAHRGFFGSSQWIGLAYVLLAALAVGLTLRPKPRGRKTARVYRLRIHAQDDESR